MSALMELAVVPLVTPAWALSTVTAVDPSVTGKSRFDFHFQMIYTNYKQWINQ